jgi:hypothetical protein
MTLAVSIRPEIGIGDQLQFSSLPENFFRETGRKLHFLTQNWFLKHNPFVTFEAPEPPQKVIELWNFGLHKDKYQWPRPRKHNVYLSNAEIHAAVLGIPAILNRPRLYAFEEFPFEKREKILLQTHGRSHGAMPPEIVSHVVKKYGPTGQLYHVGLANSPDLGLPRIQTETLWDLAAVISEARMFIGVDSGPGWIACCYPDVTVKIVRTKPTPDVFKAWVPLEVDNIHSHWDDRCRQVYNTSEEDVGFTYSYRKI